jgi:hypothetical protein
MGISARLRRILIVDYAESALLQCYLNDPQRQAGGEWRL